MNNSDLTKTTAWYTTGNLFVRSANFLLLPLYSNFIPPSEFGNYALVMSFYSAAMVLYQGGYQSALARFYYKESDPGKKKIIFSTISETAIIIALILSLGIVLTSSGISKVIFDSSDNSHLFMLIAAAMFFETTGAQFINLFIVREKASSVVVISSIGAIVNLSLNVILIYYYKMGIEGILAAQIVSAFVTSLVLIPLVKKDLLFSVNTKLLKGIFIFTFPLIAGGVLSIGVDVADRFLLYYFMSAGDVGIYSFSYRIALLMNLFVISFRTAWMPHALRHYYSGNYQNIFEGTLLKYVSAAGIIFISVSLLTDDLFNLNLGGFSLFNNEYLSGIYIIPFVLAGYLFSGISSLYSVYPFVSNKTYHFIISDGIAFILNIAVNIALIPVLGLSGAAIATLISLASGALYLILISEKNIKVNYHFQKIFFVLLTLVLLYFVGYLINKTVADFIIIITYAGVLSYILNLKPAELFIRKKN